MRQVVDSLRSLTRDSHDRFGDRLFAELFCREVAQKTDRAGMLLRGLLGYVTAAARIAGSESLRAAIDEAVGRHARRIAEKGIGLSLRCGNRLPATALPEELLSYVLDTLLSMSVDLAGAGGSVVLIAETAGDGPTDAGTPAAGPEDTVRLSVLFDRAGEPRLNPEELSQETPFRLMGGLLALHGGTCEVSSDPGTGKAHVALTLPV